MNSHVNDTDDSDESQASQFQAVPIDQLRENKSLRKLKISRGYLASIKPLIRCLLSFSHLVKLEISYVKLSKLHVMAVDNYLISNPRLRTLKLIGVKMGNDLLKLIAGTVEVSSNLRKLDLAQNTLKNGGCREIAKILKRNTSLQKLNLSQNEIKEEGLVSIVTALRENKYLLALKAEENFFGLTRGILALIGNLVTRENNTL